MSFIDAIKSVFSQYAGFTGRARRSEYWWFTLFNMIVSGIIGAILPNFEWIWTVIVFLPSLAVCVRRLHDVGKSGWFYLWIFLPLAGYIIMLIQLLKDSGPDNQWGPNPKY